MAAERRDHDRGARLRTRLAAATDSWAGSPSGHSAAQRSTTLGVPHRSRRPAVPLIFGPRRIATTGSTTETTRRRERAGPSGRPSCTGRAGAGPRRAGPDARRQLEQRHRCRAPGTQARGGGRGAPRLVRRPVARARERTSRAVRGVGDGPVRVAGPGPNGAGHTGETVAPAHPGPGCPPVTSGGGTTPCRRPPGSRPCPICRRGHPRPGTAPEAHAPDANLVRRRGDRGRWGTPTSERPAVADPAGPGMNPGTAGRRRTERPAGWRTAPVRARPSTGRATSATSGGGSAHTDTGRAVAVGASSASGSLIGDALLRELLENGLPARRAESSRDSGVSDTVVFEVDPPSRLHGRGVTGPPRARSRPDSRTPQGDRCPAAALRNPDRRRPPPPDRSSARHPAHSTTVTAVRPGRTGATHPRGPPQITAGTRVTRRTPGHPKQAHPVRVPPRAGRVPADPPPPTPTASASATCWPARSPPTATSEPRDVEPRVWAGPPARVSGTCAGSSGPRHRATLELPGRLTPAPARSPGGHARDQSDP